MNGSGTRTWEIHDALGSVRQHLAADGSVVPGGSYAYTPFGVVASGNTPAPFGFTGELHSEGLVYLRARWYDPSSGTFTSRDPFAGFPTMPYSLHPYQYGYSNPLLYTDPSGLCPQPPDQSGHVICVDLFISTQFVLGPGGAPVGYGDNRTFSSNSSPNKSRAYLYIFLDERGNFTNSELYVNRSCTITGQCIEPAWLYDTFEASQTHERGPIEIRWHLVNGVVGAIRHQKEISQGATKNAWPNGNSLTLALLACNTLWWSSVEERLDLGEIDGQLSLTPYYNHAEEPRFYNTLTLVRDPYPSLEVYHYYNGEVIEVLAQRTEHAEGPMVGLDNNTPRDIITPRMPGL